MTQEEKELLVKYLCMALPYNVKCHVPTYNCAMTLTGKRLNYFCFHKDEWGIDYSHEIETVLDPLNDQNNDYVVKPYLRQMSSMTDEEATEITSICLLDSRNILYIKIKDEYLDITVDDGFSSIETITLWYDEMISSIECLYWLLEHHFDFMNLIPNGLAIEVTESNNPYKE